jgi:ribosomal protein S18 acetylase RimI-like enzyme
MNTYGLVSNYTPSSEELHIDGIAVTKEMRGKGIGSHLINLFERVALERGFRAISLEVIDTNERAISLLRTSWFRCCQAIINLAC